MYICMYVKHKTSSYLNSYCYCAFCELEEIDKNLKPVYKSQHETILANLNRYTAKTLCLVVILMDDAIKHMLIWQLALRNSAISHLLFTSQREREAVKDKRTHHDKL